MSRTVVGKAKQMKIYQRMKREDWYVWVPIAVLVMEVLGLESHESQQRIIASRDRAEIR